MSRCTDVLRVAVVASALSRPALSRWVVDAALASAPDDEAAGEDWLPQALNEPAAAASTARVASGLRRPMTRNPLNSGGRRRS